MNRTFTIIFLFITGCSTKQNQKIFSDERFTLPLIVQNIDADTIKAYKDGIMTESFPQLIGKFKFGDTIDFSKLGQQRISEKDYLWEVQNANDSDSLSSDGLQIVPDYKTSVAYSRFEPTKHLYFPVYVVNETYEPRVFFGKDSHGFAIQEAIDTSDYSSWHPIESTGLDFCGNGRFRKKLNPKEFLIFLLPKYSGSDTTSLRIRFKIGESIFISKAFTGNINRKQFEIKDNWVLRELKETKGAAATWLFYGGNPKGNFE
jgi:hypothetical protein